MTPSKPYLIRAIYEWILDNNHTPYITIDTSVPRTSVPQQYIINNSITLDISPPATQHLLISNEAITCKARFGGISNDIYIPTTAVMAIYAHENNHGMAFPKDDYQTSPEESTQSHSDTYQAKFNKPQLKVLAGGKNQDSIDKK